jgi:hypothetical protein
MTFGSDSSVTVQKIDRSQGDWRVAQQTTVPALTWIHACASDGRTLYLAGAMETFRAQPAGAPSHPGQLLTTFVIVRVDPATLRADEIVWNERHARTVVARELAVGKDLVAVRFDSGDLEVYRLLADGRAGAPVYERRFPPPFSAAWLSQDDVVVVGSGEPEVVRVR